MKLVIVESPYAGDVEANVAYAKECMVDCLRRGEAPLASHLLYPQILDDMLPAERQLGIMAGLLWAEHADMTVVYTDHGISAGMECGIDHAAANMRPVELRSLREPIPYRLTDAGRALLEGK